MRGPYTRKCEGKSESQENVDDESAPSGTENGAAKRWSDSAEEGGEVETEQDLGRLFCRGKLQLTPCDWQQYLGLGRRGDDQCSLLDGALVRRAGVVKDDEQMRTACALCSLIGRVRLDGQRGKDFHGPRVKVRLIDAARLPEGSIVLVGGEWRVGRVVFVSI